MLRQACRASHRGSHIARFQKSLCSPKWRFYRPSWETQRLPTLYSPRRSAIASTVQKVQPDVHEGVATASPPWPCLSWKACLMPDTGRSSGDHGEASTEAIADQYGEQSIGENAGKSMKMFLPACKIRGGIYYISATKSMVILGLSRKRDKSDNESGANGNEAWADAALGRTAWKRT